MGNNLSSQEESFLDVVLFNPTGLHPTIDRSANGSDTNRNNDCGWTGTAGLVGGSAAVADFINEGLMTCSGLSTQSNTTFKTKYNTTVGDGQRRDVEFRNNFSLESDNTRLQGIPALARCDLPLPINVISGILRAEKEETPVYNIIPSIGQYNHSSNDNTVGPGYSIVGYVRGERLKGFIHHVWCLLDQAITTAASETGALGASVSKTSGISRCNGIRRGSPLPCGLAFVRVIMKTIITASCVGGTNITEELVKRLWMVKEKTNSHQHNTAAPESVHGRGRERTVNSQSAAEGGFELQGQGHDVDNGNADGMVNDKRYHSYGLPQHPIGRQVFTPAPEMLMSRLLHSLCVYITTVPVTVATIRIHIEAVKLLLTMQSTTLYHEAPFSEKSTDVLTEALLHDGSLVGAMTVVLLQRLVRYHRSAMVVVSATASGNMKQYSESALGATLVAPPTAVSSPSTQTQGTHSFDSFSSSQLKNDDTTSHYHPALAFQVAADPTLITVSASYFDPSTSADRQLDEEQLSGGRRQDSQQQGGGLFASWWSTFSNTGAQPSPNSTPQNNITPKDQQRHLKPQLHVIVRRHVSASFLLTQLSLQLLVSIVYHQKGNGVNPAMDTIRQLTDGGNVSVHENVTSENSPRNDEGQHHRIYRSITMNHGLYFKEISEVFATWLCSPAFPELSLLLYALVVENPTYLHVMLTKHMAGGVLESLFLGILSLLNASSHPVEEPPSMDNEGSNEGEYFSDNFSNSVPIDRPNNYNTGDSNNNSHFSTGYYNASGWLAWFTGVGDGSRSGGPSYSQKSETISYIPPGCQRDNGRYPFIAHNSATKLTYCFKFHLCSTLILILSQELVINNALFTTWKATQVRFGMEQAHKSTQQLERSTFSGLPPIRILSSNNSSPSSVSHDSNRISSTVTVSKNTNYITNSFSALDASYNILTSLVPYCGQNWTWTTGLLETYYPAETASLSPNSTSISGNGGPTCGSVYIMTLCRCIARSLSLRYLEAANMLIGALQNVSPFIHHLDPATSQKLTNLLSVAMRRLSRISTAEAAEMLWRIERKKTKKQESKESHIPSLGNDRGANDVSNKYSTPLPKCHKDEEVQLSHRNGGSPSNKQPDNHVIDQGLFNSSQLSTSPAKSLPTAPCLANRRRHMFHNTVVYTPSTAAEVSQNYQGESLAGYWLKRRRHFQHLYHFLAPNEAFLMYANEFDSICYNTDKYSDDEDVKRCAGAQDAVDGGHIPVRDDIYNTSMESSVLDDINSSVREELELAIRTREQEVDGLVGIVVGVAEAIVGAISASDRHNDALMYELLYNKPQLRLFPQLMPIWEQFQQPCNVNSVKKNSISNDSTVYDVYMTSANTSEPATSRVSSPRQEQFMRLPIDYASLVTDKELAKTTARFRYTIIEALEPIHDIITHVESVLSSLSVHHTPDNILAVIKSVVEEQKSVKRRSVLRTYSDRGNDIGNEVFAIGRTSSMMSSPGAYPNNVSPLLSMRLNNSFESSTGDIDLEGTHRSNSLRQSSDKPISGHHRGQLLPLPNCLELVCVYRESEGSVSFFTPFVWALITSGGGGVGVGSVPMGQTFWHRDPASGFKLLSSVGYEM